MNPFERQFVEKEKNENERHFKNREVVCKDVEGASSVDVHPEGVVFRKGNQLLLNGGKVLYEGEFDDWHSSPEGQVVIQKGNQLLLNGKELLYEGDFDGWEPHPKGIIVRKGEQLLLNGKDVVGEFSTVWHDWHAHPEGVVIREGNMGTQFTLNTFNGEKKVLYQGDYIGWGTHPEGVVIHKGNGLLLNGEKALYKGYYENPWVSHPQGAIVKEGDEWRIYTGEESRKESN